MIKGITENFRAKSSVEYKCMFGVSQSILATKDFEKRRYAENYRILSKLRVNEINTKFPWK